MNARPGFTLLEVVVALALMGSVLVATLLAFSQHRAQLSLAEKRIQATIIADQIVSTLSAQRDGIPIGTQGVVAGKANWIWQTSRVGTTTLATVPMQVFRFQILEIDPIPTQLVSVDLVRSVKQQ